MVRVKHELRTLFLGAIADHLNRASNELFERELGVLQLPLAGVDPRQIKDVIDSLEQVLRCVVDFGQSGALRGLRGFVPYLTTSRTRDSRFSIQTFEFAASPCPMRSCRLRAIQ
jgi:hypothetical protein